MRILTGICCLLLLAACGGQAAPATSAPAKSTTAAAMPSPTDRLCADPELNDKQVAFAAPGGYYLAGYLLGTGPVTLVLAPQASATGCSWLSWAKTKAAAGYRVLAFDFHDEGRSGRGVTTTNSADVAAAAAFARAKGGRDVVLVGASRGGTAVLVAAAGLEPPATAVVSLSAPSEYGGESALQAVPRLKSPVLFVAAADDGPFADSARELHGATPGDQRTLSVVPGRVHGTGLVTITADGTAQAGQAIDGFLAKYAKP